MSTLQIVAKQLMEEQKNNQALKQAAIEILALHMAEQEGIVSGQPTPTQWYKAVDALSAALQSSIHF